MVRRSLFSPALTANGVPITGKNAAQLEWSPLRHPLRPNRPRPSAKRPAQRRTDREQKVEKSKCRRGTNVALQDLIIFIAATQLAFRTDRLSKRCRSFASVIHEIHAGGHDSSTGVLKGSEEIGQKRTRVPVAAYASRELRLKLLFMATPARDRLVPLDPPVDGKLNKFA